MEGTMSEIRMFSGNFEPKAWAYCRGQLLPINRNQALFSLLGTTYGGDGISTFALPNLAGRTAVGTGTGPGLVNVPLGAMYGTEKITLLSTQLPVHTHTGGATVALPAFSEGGDLATPANNNLCSSGNFYTNATPDTTLKPFDVQVMTDVTGGNTPIQTMQPYLGMNYVICLMGLFPSRN